VKLYKFDQEMTIYTML